MENSNVNLTNKKIEKGCFSQGQVQHLKHTTEGDLSQQR